MSDVPSPGELHRRLLTLEDSLKEGFAGVNSRLDGFPTEQTLLALFQIRDSEINSIHHRLEEITKALSKEREERLASLKELEQESSTAKRWAITTALTAITIGIAIASLILSLS